MATFDAHFLPVRESLSCDDARARVLSRIPEPAIHSCSLEQSYELICAIPVYAVEPSPMFNTSAMDGYAVRALDTTGANASSPVSLQIRGSVAAGQMAPSLDGTGSAIRVMTGAPCPDGADAVIPFEKIRLVDECVIVTSPISPGSNLRTQGEDIQPGEPLMDRGVPFGPAQIALLASQGIENVDVYSTPSVAIFVTGDELTNSVTLPNGASIRDSNSLMLATLVRSMGGAVVASSRLKDDPVELLAAIRGSIRSGADMIVTVGGASAGDRDAVSDLVSIGVELELIDVRMKPGRPLVSGLIDGVPMIGLPGNPAAAFVSAMQFVQPAIQKLCGLRYPYWSEITATAALNIDNAGGRRNFVRVKLDPVSGGWSASSAGPQNAANLLTLSRADGLLVIPETIDRVQVGDQLTVQLVPGWGVGVNQNTSVV